jgi:hypothetical protein
MLLQSHNTFRCGQLTPLSLIFEIHAGFRTIVVGINLGGFGAFQPRTPISVRGPRTGFGTHSTAQNLVPSGPLMTNIPSVFSSGALSEGTVLPTLGHENYPSSIRGGPVTVKIDTKLH